MHPKLTKRLLICEGEEDKRFFERMIEAFEISPFHIESADSKDSMGAVLAKFKLERAKHYASLTDVVMVGDSDDVPDDQFKNICKQLNNFWGSSIAPKKPLVPTKTSPKFTIMLVPWSDEPGNLESLCCDSARHAKPKIAELVDRFLEDAKVDKWPSAGRRGKSWLRANLAVRCYKDPFAPLGQILSSKKWNYPKLIPMSKKIASFKRVADELLKI